jgi:protein TonB
MTASSNAWPDTKIQNQVVCQPPPQRVVVPMDIAKGMILHKVNPKYPGKAKTAHISGVVVVQGIITKQGKLRDLHVVSGPEMLVEPSLKAVQKWRYKPYLLNGEPVEVETTINVLFSLGDKSAPPPAN